MSSYLINLYGPNLSKKHSPKGTAHVVHMAGCQHENRFKGVDCEQFDCNTKFEVVEAIYSCFEEWQQGDTDAYMIYRSDVNFAPCCRAIPEGGF